MSSNSFLKFIGIGITMFVVFIFTVTNINIIESGEIGIKKVSGKYDSTPMEASIHWTAPWVSVEVVDAHQHAIN